MKIAYITRARMPTEKAHGLQIAKMCEAYTLLGHEVELVVPFRKNLIKESVPAYYGLKTNFKITTIAIPDTIVFSKWVPSVAFWLQAILFAFKLSRFPLSKETIIMTRSPDVAWFYGRRGYSVVCEAHDVPKTHLRLFKFLLKAAGSIVCNSEGTAGKVKGLGFKNVTVAQNGVDIDAIIPTVSKKIMREKLGIKEDAFVALYAGAFEAWKGYQTVLDASLNLERVTVVMLGGKPDQVALLKEKYPNVVFLGTTPYRELGNYQNIADVLIIPNDPRYKEDQENTSPIKLFAHLTSGVPVIVSDLPSIRAVVSENEVFFFDGGSTSLCHQINEIQRNVSQAQNKTQNAQKLSTKFSWVNRGKKILETIDT